VKKLILIDGNAIIHRAFHALPPFKSPEGQLVNAVYGFGSMLLNIIKSQSPTYIAVSFDTAAKTFRHEEYKEYKATRTKAPDELYAQIPLIKELVRSFSIPIYEIDGFEADDVLGTLALQALEYKDLATYIVTGDMDTTQLVTDRTFVLAPVKGFQEYKIYNPDEVYKKFALTPAQIADFKGLAGDNSDNIKGVAGIGKVSATKLLQQYKSIEGIYENLDELKGATRTKLEQGQQDALFSKKMATIITDVPMTLKLDECKTHTYDLAKIQKFFQSLNFQSLLKKLASFDQHYSKISENDKQNQQSLF